LRVASRTSAFQFKGRTLDIRTVGRRLSVGSILEGSVRKSGDRFRITAQLVSAADGYHLWSESYDRQMEDVFAVQEEIARTIGQTLKLKLVPDASRPLVRRYTENLEAYNLYLKGRYCLRKVYEGGLQKAIKAFDQAIVADRNYALAYAGLADSYSVTGLYAVLPPREAFARAKAAAEKAVEADDTVEEGHFSLGLIRYWFEWDWAGAERAFRRALALNPEHASTRIWCGALLGTVGRFEEAITEAQRACDLDPQAPLVRALTGYILYLARRYDQAVQECVRALGSDPNAVLALWIVSLIHVQQARFEEAIASLQTAVALSGRSTHCLGLLGHAYALAGRMEETEKVLKELHDRNQKEYVAPFFHALVQIGRGDHEETFRWLDRACEEKNAMLFTLGTAPLFDGLRPDQRFRDLLHRVGLSA